MRPFLSFSLVLLYVLYCLAGQAYGQPITPKGTGAALDVATWNVEFFGLPGAGPEDDTLQRAHVKSVIEQAGIDLWALQEIADSASFARLLEELPGFEGVLGDSTDRLRLAFVYDPGVVRVLGAQHVLVPFAPSFADRPPLQIEVEVTLPDTTFDLTLINVHMQSGSEPASYAKRSEAAQHLAAHVEATLSDEPLIVLGDFTDRLLSSITNGEPSPYAAFVQDSSSYRFPSVALEQTGLVTYCSDPTCENGIPVDHLLISNELFGLYVPGSFDRFDELLIDVPDYVTSTSDHLPVLAGFKAPVATAREASGGPVRAAPPRAYPNPFRERTRLTYTLAHSAHVRLEVYDLLGRRLTTLVDGVLPAGEHEAVLEAAALPAGLYLARLVTDRSLASQRLVRLR